MILTNKGIRIGNYFIPPFSLEASELVVLNLFEGAHYPVLKKQLERIFTGQEKHVNVNLTDVLTYAKPVSISKGSLRGGDKIVFDLYGQHPEAGKKIYGIVKEIVKNGGAAILLDLCDEMKDDCSKYIELKVE